MDDPDGATHEPGTVGPDRARCYARVRELRRNRGDMMRIDDALFVKAIERRLILRGCRATITPEEVGRLERIEREVG